MSVTYLTPKSFSAEAPYHHVAVATGTRHVHVAGQVGSAGECSGGLREQAALAMRHVAAGLHSAGAEFIDVVRLTFYVVGWRPEMMGDLLAGVEQVADDIGLQLPMPPASLIGVEALFDAHSLVEIEATAVC